MNGTTVALNVSVILQTCIYNWGVISSCPTFLSNISYMYNGMIYVYGIYVHDMHKSNPHSLVTHAFIAIVQFS